MIKIENSLRNANVYFKRKLFFAYENWAIFKHACFKTFKKLAI